MNKKSLIVSAAVLFTMAGMNISYAADENTSDLQSVKTPIETAKPVPLGEEPLPHEFKAPPSGAPHHFDGPGKPGPKHFERKHPSKAEMEAKKAEIEKRLKLTDEQKNEIELQKQKDREKIKPIFDEIQLKKKEFKTVLEDESLSQQYKELKLKEIKDSLRELKGQAEAVRKDNMTNFENILTEKQKKEFSKIKEEQKKEMEQRRKAFEKKRASQLKK